MPEIKFLSAITHTEGVAKTRVVKHKGQRFRLNLQVLGDGLEAVCRFANCFGLIFTAHLRK
jgi:hypothetical protein